MANKDSPGLLAPLATPIRLLLLAIALTSAYQLRLYAIETYGRVIHEFDPWFNYRATEYLAANGLSKFFKWFDYMSWYPLGRPVGTTIYPGMQMTSVLIWNVLNAIGIEISLNDVCCFVPAWGGVSATIFLGLFTYETSRSKNAAVVASLIMAIVPAHMMRSIGGGYDNESVAMTAMVATFYFWCRSLRDDKSATVWGAVTGVAYMYMAAVWGGYIFVLNMIGVHAGALVMVGRYSPKLHRAYSLFYVIGTFGAMQVPVVGWSPLKSMEQLPCLVVFLGMQVMFACEMVKKQRGMSAKQYLLFRLKAFAALAAGIVLIGLLLAPTGFFGPISSRIRGLFLKHTRTGNPLVDSVAEHQPGSSKSYYQYLHFVCYIAPIGFLLTVAHISDANIFVLLYATFAYFFSAKMVRLILLLGPIASALGGVAIASLAELSWAALTADGADEDKAEPSSANKASGGKKSSKKTGSARNKVQNRMSAGKKKRRTSHWAKLLGPGQEWLLPFEPMFGPTVDYFATVQGKSMGKLLAVLFLVSGVYNGMIFTNYCKTMAKAMSSPSIMYQATLRSGEQIIVDDYREAYHYLRDETPLDARVMAWWDYGYQITGIGNRTTIADGNTWNHEHIATLGRCLVSPEKEAHKLVRHLADYLLIWTGGGGDDLAKSPHMARITNSVYSDICPNDPTCRKFGFLDHQMNPKPMMAESLLYKLHSHNQKPGVRANPKLFKEVFRSEYNKVRIFKVLQVSEESKAWVADPSNRVCDAPGSWYCNGQYPPAVQRILKKLKGKDFQQLEDFNVDADEKNTYHQDYMDAMSGRHVPNRDNKGEEDTQDDDEEPAAADAEEEEEVDYAEDEDEDEDDAEVKYAWQNTADTTRLWHMIDRNDVEGLRNWINTEPYIVHLRSEDGRGPLWWAYENGREEIVDLLVSSGSNPQAEDSQGKHPEDMK